MSLRATQIWITVTVLALGAEGSALAQSAPSPSRACSASDPTLACMAQWNAPVGPALEAARASMGGTTKKSDTGAAIDLNSLANRQPIAGKAVANGLAMPSGAGAPIQSNAGGGDNLQVLHGDATGATSTAAGPPIRVVPIGNLQDGWGSVSVPSPLAETVVRGQINPAAKSCYESAPDSKSRRPGRLVMLIKVAPAGGIDSVSVLRNIGVSPSVASCIMAAAGAAKFAAPGANGTTVHAAFTFPGQEDVAPPAAARATGVQVPNASGPAVHETLAKADTQPTNGEASRVPTTGTTPTSAGRAIAAAP
jgi:hypothetical protein